jgi:cytoskeletal protein CcmA (bactofilin family)
MSAPEGAKPRDDKVRCPRCQTTHLKVLQKLDRIEKIYGNVLLNRIRARRGDTIYHCVFCRLQFYDPRKPGAGGTAKGGAEKSSAEKTEPEPGKKVARAAASRRQSPRTAAELVPSLSTATNGTKLSAGVTIRGSIQSAEDIYVDGRIEGTLASQNHRITLGPNAKVKASVRASEVEVMGTLHGNSLIGSRMILRKGSKVIGDIKTCDIVIERGAQFKGSLKRVRHQAHLPG